jgi:SAM-dependent methyltransferase
VDNCPLCSNPESRIHSQDKFRSYLKCDKCELIFVSRGQLIGPDEEKERYDSHQNNPDDAGYQSYLNKMVELIAPKLQPAHRGLDFGCGRTTLLASLFKARGFILDSFDLYFFSHAEIWQKKYDFIVLSEVIEHLREPLEEMKKLRMLLNPGGQIFIKTKFYPDSQVAFENWFYKRDKTHIQFFNHDSMHVLGQKISLIGPEVLGEDLFVLRE